MAVRIKWNTQALYDLRREPGVVAELESMAQRICDRANAEGEGTYAVGSQQGARNPQGRWRTTVVTADYRAIRDNAKHNTLIRVMY
ncbi:hypothetical protein [Gordonia tangerina]|uniref:Uncharacterized protein n=1 Tax=Gordonia tangerina TaxID=2911060 RepID=A0ABS9DQE4_9ACTN|nr:hypothetical protein [Gordonia tangerina]MCF3941323.1 hypothetical protein [Gordonia tangerina]